MLSNFFNRHAVAVRTFLAVRPFGKHVGNVIGVDWRALIVETVAVGGQIIEPDALRRLALLENQCGGTDTGIGLEHTAGEANDGLQVAFG